ncbi:unnamed protein product [Echinostoma caproni]|uniref:Dymeclin n=1 Tax=Echinostoma caproni TaxID=27848 RepID=A0A183AW48_9TREM|nr:unnamed protein product [Echinostoma caproni]
MHSVVDQFLTTKIEDAEVCTSIFYNNPDLSCGVSRKLIHHFFRCLQSNEPHPYWIRLFIVILSSQTRPKRALQDLIAGELYSMHGTTLNQLFCATTIVDCLDQVELDKDDLQMDDRTKQLKLNTHLELIRLVSLTAAGRNGLAQTEARNRLRLADLVRLVMHPTFRRLNTARSSAIQNTLFHLRCAYVAYLDIVFVDTENPSSQLYIPGSLMWQFWSQIDKELEQVSPFTVWLFMALIDYFNSFVILRTNMCSIAYCFFSSDFVVVQLKKTADFPLNWTWLIRLSIT